MSYSCISVVPYHAILVKSCGDFLLIDIIEDTLASNTPSEKWGKKIKEKDPFQ